MFQIIFVIIFLAIILIKSGSKELFPAKLPFYTVSRQPDCSLVLPDKLPLYCEGKEIHVGSEIPNYNYQMKKIFEQFGNAIYSSNNYRHYSFICNEYGNLYSSIKYLHSVFTVFKNDVIYIDSYNGIVPNLLAEIFGMQIHFFSLKPTIKLHRNVTHYKRLPNESDFTKLRNCILISFALFMAADSLKAGQMLQITQHEYQNFLYFNFRPRTALLLYTGSTKEGFIVEGSMYLVPFYFVDRTGFFLVNTPVREFAGLKIKRTDIPDISNRLLAFNLCKRNLVSKDMKNWDLQYAEEAIALVGHRKLIYSMLGPLPVIKKRSDIPCEMIRVQIVNSHLKNPGERKILETSYFTENYEKIAKQLKLPLTESTPQVKILPGRYNEVYIPRLEFMQFVFNHIRSQNKTLAFYNNVEYFCEFLMAGRHYFTQLVTNVKRFAELIGYTKMEIGTESELKNLILERGSVLIPENFICMDVIKAFKSVSGFLPKQLGHASYIWIDPSPVMIECLHYTWPNLKFKILGSYYPPDFRERLTPISYEEFNPREILGLATTSDYYFNCI